MFQRPCLAETLLSGIFRLLQKEGFGIILSHKAGSATGTEIKPTYSPDINLLLAPGSARPDKNTVLESCVTAMVHVGRRGKVSG